MATLVYQDLFAMYRQERGSNALSTLPDGFDESLENVIIELTKKSQTDPQALKELENTRKLAISIIGLRRQKIILRAINAQEAKLLGANQREQDFYEKILSICSAQDKWLNKLITSKAPEVVVIKTKKIKMLKDVPQYTAADGKSYGPYATGEEIELAQTEAKWMVEGKLAQDF